MQSALARRGVLTARLAAVERLARVDTLACDKTGTLTLPVPELMRIVPLRGLDATTLLARGAALEALSNHPFARALTRAARIAGVTVPQAVDGVVEAGFRVGDLRAARLQRGDVDGTLEGEASLPFQALVNPRREEGDFFRRERVALGRHALLRVLVRDTTDQFARPALARDDGPGLEKGLARVHRHRALVLAVGVALGAARLDDGHDVVGEINRLRLLGQARLRPQGECRDGEGETHKARGQGTSHGDPFGC